MLANLFLYVVCSMASLSLVRGHGRLMEPPSRSSMWRLGFNTPHNYNDNELFCGGYEKLKQNGGKCGVCGDPFDGERKNEAGGVYANGIITRQYQQGQTITVEAEITANHKGYFEMRLCPNNNPEVPVTQDCLDQHLLLQPDGSVRYYVDPDKLGAFVFEAVLPADVTCTQCVIQWKYHTGNSWACGDGGECCVGCGLQEEFYGCSDIAIEGTGDRQTTKYSQQTTTSIKKTTPVKQTTTPVKQTTTTTTTERMTTTDTKIPTIECRAVGRGLNYLFMKEWCLANCLSGYCPSDFCSPACRSVQR